MTSTMWNAVNNQGPAVASSVSGGVHREFAYARREGLSGAMVETLATLHRILTLGVHLLDTADIYTWGLQREFAAVRTTCAAQLAAVAEEPIALPSKVVEMRRRDRLHMAGVIRRGPARPVTQPERDPAP